MIYLAAMSPPSIIALSALAISAFTFIAMLIGQRHTVSTDYISRLERRIEALEKELEIAEKKITALEDKNTDLLRENIELLRRLAHANNT